MGNYTNRYGKKKGLINLQGIRIRFLLDIAVK